MVEVYTPVMEMWDSTIREPGAFERLIDFLKKKGFSIKDHEDLEQRFSPFASFPQYAPLDLWAFFGFLAEEAFSMEKIPCYMSDESVDDIQVKGKSNESGYHLYLKKLATRWLKTERQVHDVVYEMPYSGGISDVASADCLWIVECGCCRPDKVYGAFKIEHPENRRLILFNGDSITSFKPGPRFSEYQKSRHQDDLRIAAKVCKAMEGFWA